MTLARVLTRAQAGVDSPAVTVEVYLARGLPRFTVVGLPETAVREARERVRAAIVHSGFDFPARAITVNLAPADLPKEGGRYDVAIAIGILAATRQVPTDPLQGVECYGELSLGGTLRPIRGAVCVASAAAEAGRAVILPVANGAEAALERRATVHAAASLEQVCAHLTGRRPLATLAPTATPTSEASVADLADVQGQEVAVRALEVAAAGGHSLLMVGPPGTGKTMLASRLPGLLPPLNERERLESAKVYSLAGQAPPVVRPFRAPHHSASAVAVLGGGVPLRPGEISLAHGGVLFLDELAEFRRDVLEALREPLEAGTVLIARAKGCASFPADFQLVAAMNPCPCGYFGEARCRCTPAVVSRYRQRISGPLLDRLDLQLYVARPEAVDPQPKRFVDGASVAARSVKLAERVAMARDRQRARFGALNAALSVSELHECCEIDGAGRELLRRASERFSLSMRAYHRVLRVARTVADLAQESEVQSSHLAEALGWRVALGERWAGVGARVSAFSA